MRAPRRAMRQLGIAVLLSLSLWTAGCASLTEADEQSAEQSAAMTEENPDPQSAEEIATARATVERDFADAVDVETIAPEEQARILAGYTHLDPQRVVPRSLLETAVAYFDRNKNSFPNKKYITVVNLKARSDSYRFFLVNMTTGSVERYHTSHGRGGDTDDDGYADSFSNVPNSEKSSLGFVRTAEVYTGAWGKSVRLDGLSTTNSKIRERAVVFHGWVETVEANVKQGRTRGCITLDNAKRDAVLAKIKAGSLMYVGLGS